LGQDPANSKLELLIAEQHLLVAELRGSDSTASSLVAEHLASAKRHAESVLRAEPSNERAARLVDEVSWRTGGSLRRATATEPTSEPGEDPQTPPMSPATRTTRRVRLSQRIGRFVRAQPPHRRTMLRTAAVIAPPLVVFVIVRIVMLVLG
jgi:hypothetical protein